MSLQERLPGHGATTDRIYSLLSQHALDRVSSNLVAEVHERALHSRVSPTRIIEGHPYDEMLDLAFDSGPPGAPLRAPVVFLRHQLAIPAKKRVGRDECGDLSELASAQAFHAARKPAGLGVRELKALSAEPLSKNTVLLLQILDHFLLVSVQSSGQQDESELQRHGCHRVTLARPGRAKFD
ncbi:MAG: hypothetical protein JRF61_15980 [Deltaproteobacteria bacterium]|nr:hypothetical protein [Deltaproteobacteria bacterium]